MKIISEVFPYPFLVSPLSILLLARYHLLFKIQNEFLLQVPKINCKQVFSQESSHSH